MDDNRRMGKAKRKDDKQCKRRCDCSTLTTATSNTLRFRPVPFDEVKPRQVDTSKRLVFDVPFLELSLRKPQMEDLQAVLYLRKTKTKDLVLDIC